MFPALYNQSWPLDPHLKPLYHALNPVIAAWQTIIIDEPMAAAIGAGMAVHEALLAVGFATGSVLGGLIYVTEGATLTITVDALRFTTKDSLGGGWSRASSRGR